MSWIRGAVFYDSAPHHFTENQCRSKIQRKKWVRGREFAVIDGERYFNPEAIDEWIGQQAAHQVVAESSSDGDAEKVVKVKSWNSRTTTGANARQLV